jgi:hypothetical protein
LASLCLTCGREDGVKRRSPRLPPLAKAQLFADPRFQMLFEFAQHRWIGLVQFRQTPQHLRLHSRR